MPAPAELELFQWNVMMDAFNRESDRGAAVLVAGFVENYLGSYLRSLVKDPQVAGDLFGAMGPLSSFSQRIAVAYAFGFITKEHYENLTLVRRIRNHFAHHPLDVSFATNEVAQLAKRLSSFQVAKDSHPRDDAEIYRRAYMFASAFFCGYAHAKRQFPDGTKPTAIYESGSIPQEER
ncbi:MltR family transcriptional regulator [Ramlibacter alkalitolerans]|uniref:Transcriptional regulator n=1 Tax=Ramlibacter alkalitolerans TaxID=2039631 RepID=A0ABS1JW84_9BURK|nr:MltR family transcriptional regulator [Ramlibacter alkalitolerans]MBL0428488.1 hypothetical protein [Ramlibacter alkalitolerans]